MEKGARKQHILEALAEMIEQEPAARVTTKGLALRVGVSEAALYRHFPSKTRMFEELIDFAAEATGTSLKKIIAQGDTSLATSGRMLTLVLLFAERNPGIARLLTGDVLAGEDARLHQQISQYFDRIESQLKQLLRQAEYDQGLRTRMSAAHTANLLMAVVQGLIWQFVHTGFKRKPSDGWEQQWQTLQAIVFREP